MNKTSYKQRLKISHLLPLLSKLKDSGVKIRLVNGQVKINAPKGRLTTELIRELKVNKNEIIRFLQTLDVTRVEYTSLYPTEKKEYYPLSSAQKRLYILQQMTRESTAYNIPQFLELEGEVDLKRLEKTFGKLIDRHESLRTSLEIIRGEPIQRVHEEVKFEIKCYLVTEKERKIGREEARKIRKEKPFGQINAFGGSEGKGARGLAPLSKDLAASNSQLVTSTIKNFIRPFDLSQAPLLRVGMFHQSTRSGRGDILMVDMHHIISDGISRNIFIKDFLSLFNGKRLPSLRFQYKDYCTWQQWQLRTNVFKKQEEYWLKEYSEEIPVLNLHCDYSRPAVQSFEGQVMAFEISREETTALNEVAQSQKATLFMVLLAVFNIFLSKLNNQEDIVVGTPIAGRSLADMEQIIGMFVNTLTLRNYPSAEKTFPEFLKEVKEKTLRAFDNQDYQFEELVGKVEINRDMSRNPIFDVMFVFQNHFNLPGEIPGKQMEGLKVRPYANKRKTSKFDLTLDAAELNEKLYFSFEYCTELFKDETIVRFIKYFKKVISLIVENPTKKISGIEILTGEEKKHLLVTLNDTAAEYPHDKTIHELFEEQVIKTPDNIAVLGPRLRCMGNLRRAGEEPCALTYRKLNNESQQLANRLSTKGVKPNTIVPIMLERSIEMIMGLMAILKSGGAYLPIDPDHPPARIKLICKDCHSLLMLTDGEKENLAHYIPGSIEVVNIREKGIYHGNQREANDMHAIDNIIHPGNLVYVIYTSGSTGIPKGVMIEHRNAVNVFNWFGKKYNLRSSVQSTHVLMISDYTFDPSVNQIFGSLIHGAVLYIVSKNLLIDFESMRQYIDTYQIQLINSVPLMLKELLSGDRKLGSIRYVLSGGEKLNDSTKDMIIKRGYRLYNQYGLTETTIDALVEKCSPDKVTAGCPISNVKCYIFDFYIRPLPMGVVGELNIGGANVARGYLNRAALTAERFIKNPYIPGTRMYKTGDLARWLAGSRIEFLGRIDQQVKIRGYRIERGEIEHQLLNYGGIKEAVLIDRKDKNKNKYLCAYIVSNQILKISRLKEYLTNTLPDYMIPSFFVQLEKLPLTPNGKIDCKSLPEPDVGLSTANYIPPGDEVEEKLAAIWSETLGIEKKKISIENTFFELGGNSLGLTTLISTIYKEFHVEVPITQLFNQPRIKDISRVIKSKKYTEEPVILLNQLTNKKIFCFPPRIAYGYIYSHLASMINDYSFYSFNFIEEKNRLKKYVDIITDLQPVSPYILFGWSAAGQLTFEVANALEKHGGEVSDIILVDSFWDESPRKIGSEIQKRYSEDLEKRIQEMGIEFIKEKIKRKVETYQSYRKYITTLETVNATVHLILSKEGKVLNLTNCWDEFTTKPTLIYQGFGSHGHMLLPGDLEKNTEVIREILDKIESENRCDQAKLRIKNSY